jgi:hypothetical protein
MSLTKAGNGRAARPVACELSALARDLAYFKAISLAPRENASHSEATALPSRTSQRVSSRPGSTELSFSADFPRGLTLKIAMSSVLFDILAT